MGNRLSCRTRSLEGEQARVLRLVLKPGFGARLTASPVLQARVLRELPHGLQTLVHRGALFDVLEVEVENNLLIEHLFNLLDVNDDGFVLLEELLGQLARCSAGLPLRVGHVVDATALPEPREWSRRDDALELQAAFAFHLFDLDNKCVKDDMVHCVLSCM
jgi:hypothetical protein